MAFRLSALLRGVAMDIIINPGGAASGAGRRGGARFGAGGGGGGGGRSGLREICIFSSIGPELLELAAGLCIFSSIRSKSAIARSSSFIV